MGAIARRLLVAAGFAAAVASCGDDSEVTHVGGSAGGGGDAGNGAAAGEEASPGGTRGAVGGEGASEPADGGSKSDGGVAGAGANAGVGATGSDKGTEGGAGGATPVGGGGADAGLGGGGNGGGGNGGGGDGGDAGGAGPVAGFRWAKVLNAETHGLVRSSAGLVTASQFTGAPFDAGCGEMVTSDGSLLVASFRESDGACRWSPQFSPGGGGMPLDLELGADGRLYLGGNFSGPSLDLGGGPLPKLVANWNAPFVGVFELGASGLSHVWSTAFDGRGQVEALQVGTGLNVAGTSYLSVKIDGQYAAPCCFAGNGAFATRLNAADDAAWVAGARAVSSTSLDEVLVQDVAESGGTVFVTGRIDGPVTFGATPVTPTGWGDIFLAGYDATSGALKFVKHWGAASTYGIGRRLLVEPGGSVVLGAVANEGTDFGDGALVGSQNHVLLARFDSAGNVLKTTSLHVDYGNVFDLARRSNGELVVFGMFRRTLTLGGATLVPEAHGDPFVATLSADFSTWAHAEAITTPTEDFNPGRLTLTSDGSIALALNFQQWVDARGTRFTGGAGWSTLLGVLE